MLLIFFRHGSNSLLAALMLAISALFAFRYLQLHAGAMLLGALIFFVAEYVTHRFAFHAAGRWMKKYHLLHHYLNERLWYGVTNPSMDLLARTYMPASEAERSTRTRVLYP